MRDETNPDNKALVRDHWQALDRAGPGELASVVESAWADEVTWHGLEPLGEVPGAGAFAVDFWLPLKRACPDLERRTHLLFGDIAKVGKR